MAHYLDWLYLASTLRKPLFEDGWGDIFQIPAAQASELESIPKIELTPIGPPTPIPNGARWELTFRSPYQHPKFPEESHQVPVRILTPQHDISKTQKMTIMIPASGDEGYGQREPVALKLLELGIGSVMFEGAYYGKRRPSNQRSTCLRTVGDLGHLALATIEDARALAGWLYREGVGRIGFTGVSRGGQMAVIAASVTRIPIAATAMVSSFSASPIYTQGLISKRICWDRLTHPLGAQEALAQALDLSDVRHYPRPVCEESIHLIGARADGYVKPGWVANLHRYLPEANLSWVAGGHVSAYLFEKDTYAQAIERSLASLPGTALRTANSSP